MCFFRAYSASILSGFKLNNEVAKLTEGKEMPFFERTYRTFLFVIFTGKCVSNIQKSDILFPIAPYGSSPK